MHANAEFSKIGGPSGFGGLGRLLVLGPFILSIGCMAPRAYQNQPVGSTLILDSIDGQNPSTRLPPGGRPSDPTDSNNNGGVAGPTRGLPPSAGNHPTPNPMDPISGSVMPSKETPSQPWEPPSVLPAFDPILTSASIQARPGSYGPFGLSDYSNYSIRLLGKFPYLSAEGTGIGSSVHILCEEYDYRVSGFAIGNKVACGSPTNCSSSSYGDYIDVSLSVQEIHHTWMGRSGICKMYTKFGTGSGSRKSAEVPITFVPAISAAVVSIDTQGGKHLEIHGVWGRYGLLNFTCDLKSAADGVTRVTGSVSPREEAYMPRNVTVPEVETPIIILHNPTMMNLDWANLSGGLRSTFVHEQLNNNNLKGCHFTTHSAGMRGFDFIFQL